MALSVPQEFGWNILAACGIAFQVIVTGGMVSKVRRKYGVDYPDMGCGRFSKKLTDDQWKDFNNWQRAHYNYVEGVASAITFQLLAGLFYPTAAAWAGLAYIIGRHMYWWGYTASGPKGRIAGVLVFDVALLVKLGLAVYGSLKLLNFF